MKSHVIHFTTVHPRTDTRIRVKEAATLARVWPGAVALYVQDGKGDETDAQDGVAVHDTGPPERGRLRRMTRGAFRMYRAVRRARPRIAHFHDPELLPWAMLLRLRGVIVIYDMHEDFPRQLLGKSYLTGLKSRIFSNLAASIERVSFSVFDHFVLAFPSLQSRFSGEKATVIANFAMQSEFPALQDTKYSSVSGRFVYVGGVSSARGAFEMVDAIALVKDSCAHLRLLGTFTDHGIESELKAREGWVKVEFLGWCDREIVASELGSAVGGLVVLQPVPLYLVNWTIKMFEYMAAGLPVIASDFPLWREIVEGAGCGLLVDPQDPQAIADAMQWVLDNPVEAAAMGRRGRAAVEERYNWEAESDKLIALYRRLLADDRL